MKREDHITDIDQKRAVIDSMYVSERVINTLEDLKNLPHPTPYVSLSNGTEATHFVKASDDVYLVFGIVVDPIYGHVLMKKTAEEVFEIIEGETVISATLQFHKHNFSNYKYTKYRDMEEKQNGECL